MPQPSTEYESLAAELRDRLEPEGPLENLCVDEILNAAWRLRRCTLAEQSLESQISTPEPMLDPQTAAQQLAIDRARAQANRLFQHSVAELRRLQADRLVRDTVTSESATEHLADYREPVSTMAATTKLKMNGRRLQGVETIEKVIHNSIPRPDREPETGTPRSAPCPCGSREKYKRCCGKDAPPVLHPGAPPEQHERPALLTSDEGIR